GRVRVPESKSVYKDIIFSVKSGKVSSKDIRDLKGVLDREKAVAGIFITLNEPTKDMKQEAAAAGIYKNPFMGDVEKIKIVTIKQIIKGELLSVPIIADSVKKAEFVGTENEQMKL
ncbi:MAG: restriction endonuclease, partial [Oscillospiraceae bacterium]|nr:restriction endonuclease [Oscillospiraceae bacterium]